MWNKKVYGFNHHRYEECYSQQQKNLFQGYLCKTVIVEIVIAELVEYLGG